MKKAEITAFLSLVFVLLVSFVLGMLQISVIHTSKNLSRLGTDRAVFSLFGEYKKELLEQYHVFAIDGAYGTGEFSGEKLLGRMYYYGDGLTEHEITEIQFLTDNKGQAFREQVIAYMEETYGLGSIRDITGLTAEWEEQEIQGKEIGEKEEELLKELEEMRSSAPSPDENKEGSAEKITENPFTCIEQIENAGILSVVMPDDMELSAKKIHLQDQASRRVLNTGRGTFPARQGTGGIEERFLFQEYVLKNFTNAAQAEKSDDQNGRSLEYEVEYILSGKDSDKDNLESVLLKIFLIRMALNYVYLMGDTEKQAEAEALAVTISLILLMPEGTEVLKQLVLFAWAAGESVVDIRTLLSGNRVPLVKTKENWQVSLSRLLTLGSGSGYPKGEDSRDGISYEEYLMGFLFLADEEDVTMRTIDRVEENIASGYGPGSFRADHCVTKIRMENTAVIFGDVSYTYPVYFGYD